MRKTYKKSLKGLEPYRAGKKKKMGTWAGERVPLSQLAGGEDTMRAIEKIARAGKYLLPQQVGDTMAYLNYSFESVRKCYKSMAYMLLFEAIDYEGERGEFARYGDPDKEIAAAKKGKLVKVRKEHISGFWKGKTNTGVGDIKPGLGGLRQTVKLLKKSDRNKARRRKVYNLVRSGQDEPSIMRGGDLVAGNTRAMMRHALGLKPKVHRYKAPIGNK